MKTLQCDTRTAPAEVIHVTTGLSRCGGGPFYSVSGLAKAVAQSKALRSSVVGAYRDWAAWGNDCEQWTGIDVAAVAGHGLKTVGPLVKATASRIHEVLARHDVPIVHLHGIWDAGSLVIERTMKAFVDLPVVVSPRGMLEPWALRQRRIKKTVAWTAWQRRVFMAAGMVHATADQECDNLRRLGLRMPIAVVPNGIEIPEVPERIPSGSTRRCVFLSRIHPKKGLPMLLEAWRRVAPSGWTLEIAGTGEGGHDDEIRQLIRRHQLSSVSLVGELSGSSKWTFLRSADLFVLPSHSENFGMAIAEAMGAGLPVITTTETPWEAIRERQLGWWVEPTVDSLTAALVTATRSPAAELIARGARARQYVLREYGWASIGKRMIQCYLWLIGVGPASPDLRFA